MTERELTHIPDRLLRDLGEAPIMPEHEIELYVMTGGRKELTKKELEILRYLSHGLHEEDVARMLGKAHATIKGQLRGIRFILRAKNTTHAVARALRLGLID